MKTMRRVEVEWIDSNFSRGWGSLDTIRKEMDVATCRSVGYVLEKTPKVLKLIMSHSGTSASDGLSIPRVAIRKIRSLRSDE